MKVYFEETGDNFGEIDIMAYVSPKPCDGGYCGYEYDLFGKRSKFEWADPEGSRVYDHKELPADMWYSIRHGENNFTVDKEKKGTWSLSDLRYDKVDREMVNNALKSIKMIDECKNLSDVYDVYVKYVKGGYLDFDFVQKALDIIEQEEIPMVNGELGFYGMMNTALFIDLMNYEEERRAAATKQGDA